VEISWHKAGKKHGISRMMTQRGEIISTTYHEGMWHGERTVAYSNGSVNTAYYKRGKKASQAEIENFKLEL
jgi:antitoxin component YwqK of YwqJK toxin-antitoxin module